MNIKNNNEAHFFATTPKGLELLLVDELRALGANNVAEKLAGVTFTGDLRIAYQACLWSRLANRILLLLGEVRAETADELYAGVQSIIWDEHIDPHSTFAVHFVSSQSQITHSLFGAQKVKDAIVDQLREKYGVRPNVSRDRPDVSVYVYLYRDTAFIHIDLSGESLHKRGYRQSSVAAPLKENLAAAILLRANWFAIAKNGGTLLDPMCGSGTLLIEAAMMAGDIAPGIAREYFGFLGWKKHQQTLWQSLRDEALQRAQVGTKNIPTIVGYDYDTDAIKSAFENIERANMRGKIHVEKRELDNFVPKANAKPGLVVCNPPYGERLGEITELQTLYTQIGDKLKKEFVGWHAAIFTGNPDLGKQMGIRAKNYYAFFNGAIPCKLLLFEVQENYFVDRSPQGENERRIRAAKRAVSGQDNSAVQMFVNRLQKNLKHFTRQAKRLDLALCRVYDADLPEYAFVIDVDFVKQSAQVQEYAPPKTVDKQKALRRQQEVLAVLPEILQLAPAQIYFSIIHREHKNKKNN